jgi:putative membrane protein
MQRFNLKAFLLYKALNSAFTGLSIGVFFTLYAPLRPVVYSVGGIALAVGVLVLAKFYAQILNYRWFFRFSLFVELVMVALIAVVLVGGFGFASAFAVYVGYQISFMFGSYLLRVESLVLRHAKVLETIDVVKQIGYIAGLAVSYGFYEYFDAWNNETQVYYLHFGLLGLEGMIIWFLIKGFGKI